VPFVVLPSTSPATLRLSATSAPPRFLPFSQASRSCIGTSPTTPRPSARRRGSSAFVLPPLSSPFVLLLCPPAFVLPLCPPIAKKDKVEGTKSRGQSRQRQSRQRQSPRSKVQGAKSKDKEDNDRRYRGIRLLQVSELVTTRGRGFGFPFAPQGLVLSPTRPRGAALRTSNAEHRTSNAEYSTSKIQHPRSNPPTPPFPRPLELPRVRELRGRWM
jgi:hypothetical protein